MEFAYIDVFFALVIVLAAVNDAIKGFIHEFFSKAAFVLGGVLAFLFYKKVDMYISQKVTIEMLSNIISFLCIFVAVFIVVKILQVIIKKAFSGEILGSLDHALGFLFGLAEGLVVVLVIMFALTSQPWFDVSGLLAKSFFYQNLSGFLSTSVEAVKEMVAI